MDFKHNFEKCDFFLYFILKASLMQVDLIFDIIFALMFLVLIRSETKAFPQNICKHVLREKKN